MTALSQAHVAMVMGSAFGTEGYARLSFATDLDTLRKGFDALARVPGRVGAISYSSLAVVFRKVRCCGPSPPSKWDGPQQRTLPDPPKSIGTRSKSAGAPD